MYIYVLQLYHISYNNFKNNMICIHSMISLNVDSSIAITGKPMDVHPFREG